MPVDATRQVDSATASTSRPCLEKQVRASHFNTLQAKDTAGRNIITSQREQANALTFDLFACRVGATIACSSDIYFGLNRAYRKISRSISKKGMTKCIESEDIGTMAGRIDYRCSQSCCVTATDTCAPTHTHRTYRLAALLCYVPPRAFCDVPTRL